MEFSSGERVVVEEDFLVSAKGLPKDYSEGPWHNRRFVNFENIKLEDCV